MTGTVAPRRGGGEAHAASSATTMSAARRSAPACGDVRVREPGGDRDCGEPRIAERVAGVEHGDPVGSRRHALEQACLGREVRVAGAVQLQVLGGDPREDRGPERDVVDAMHLEPVRRRLERDVGAPAVADAGELGLQLRRLRRRLARRIGDHRVVGPAIDGGDRRGGDARSAPRVPEQRRRGGLAVGASDPRDAEARGSGGRRRRAASAESATGGCRRRAPAGPTASTAASGRRSATTATAPRVDRVAAEPMPVGAQPGDGDEQASGATAREFEVDRGDARPRVHRRVRPGRCPARRADAASGRPGLAWYAPSQSMVGSLRSWLERSKSGSAPDSLADALTATRSARRRVLALAARLEATERTILAAMASARSGPATPAAAPAPAAKRPVGRPRKAPSAAPAAKRPVGRPRKTRRLPRPRRSVPSAGRARPAASPAPARRTSRARARTSPRSGGSAGDPAVESRPAARRGTNPKCRD